MWAVKSAHLFVRRLCRFFNEVVMERKLSINDIAAYLDEIGLQYMATIGLDGKPKVRPVQYMILREL